MNQLVHDDAPLETGTQSAPAPKPAPQHTRLEYLDGWRGLAISALLLGHFLHLPGGDFGRLGVDLFFVLSGLLMARLLFIHPTPIATFYKRRVSRIFPAFFFFLACIFGGYALMGTHPSWGEALATFTFLRTYLPSDLGIWESRFPIGHVWSLNIEEHSYFFLGIVAVLFRGRPAVAMATLGLSAGATFVCFLAYARGINPPPSFELRTECGAAPILLACAAHVFIKHHKVRLPSWASPVLLVSAILLYTRIAPWYGRALLAPVLLTISVNGLEFAPPIVHRLLSRPALRWLGVTSYSIYLWQQPIYHARALIPSYVGLPLALLIGALSFYGFENPVRRILNRMW